MEREIKFKAKSSATHSWVEGDLLHKDGRTYIRKDKVILADVYPDTVCQFTGLKDCTDTDLYEGDIILLQDYEWLVLWDDISCTFMLENMECDRHFYNCRILHDCTFLVIGNKFDEKK